MRILISAVFLITISVSALASTIRFSDLDSRELNSVLDGQSEHVVEFKKGDLIPLNLNIEGDLLSLSKKETNLLKVKRDFFVKSKGSILLISFDGLNYHSLSESLTGRLSVGANGNSIPSMLNVLLHVEER